MRNPRSYYVKTTEKVAQDLGLSRQEVSLNVSMFFKSLRIAAQKWMWVRVKGYFKFRMSGKHWRMAMRRGFIDSKYDYQKKRHPEFVNNNQNDLNL